MALIYQDVRERMEADGYKVSDDDIIICQEKSRGFWERGIIPSASLAGCDPGMVDKADCEPVQHRNDGNFEKLEKRR